VWYRVDYSPRTSHAEGFDELIDELNSELIIVGLVSLIDPLKPDIPDTVRYEKKKSPMHTLAVRADDFTHQDMSRCRNPLLCRDW
jgi:hypothetical protein